MDFKELLEKQGLTEEQITAIVNAMAENKIYTTKEEKIDERYNKLKIKKEALETELKEANAAITDLKKNNKDNEALQTKVKEYESTIETLKNEGKKKNFEMALELELTKADVKNTKAVKALIDQEKLIQNEDGTITGLNEQLAELKKSDSYLFNTKEVIPKPYNPEGGKASTGDLATLMKNEDFNLTEYLKKQNRR